METVIVLAGLMLVVPRVDPTCLAGPKPEDCDVKSLTVLVLDTDNACPQLGEQVRLHQRDIRNFGGPGVAGLSGTWTVKSAAPGPIDIEQKERLLYLSKVYGNNLPPVRKECLSESFSWSCLVGSSRLVAAQIHFEGGWTVRPLEIDQSRQPFAKYLDEGGVLKNLQDDAVWDFLRVRDGRLPVATSYEMKLSNSLLFMSKGPSTVTISGPNADQFDHLAALTPDLCMLHVGVSTSCSIVRVLNALDTRECAIPSVERLETDHHHNIVYNLFRPVPVDRYLLFLRKNSSPLVKQKLYPTGGGSLGCRPCVPPMFSMPVSVEGQ